MPPPQDIIEKNLYFSLKNVFFILFGNKISAKRIVIKLTMRFALYVLFQL